MRRVVATGLGAVTPLGVGVRQSWKRLIEGRSGLASTDDRGEDFTKLPCRVAGLVPQRGAGRVNTSWNARDWLSESEERRLPRFTQYAIAAAHEALEDAAWNPSDEERETTGVCLGSGIGSLDDAYDTSVAFHEGGYRKVSPLFVPKLLINMAAGHLSMIHGFKGPNHSVTTACTTGAHSIGDAARFIAFGDADTMLAGGAESCIHSLAFAGFARARSLATAFNMKPEAASRPFDRDRNGFVIGEGSGVVVLEEFEHAKARGARIYAEVKGYGTSGEAYHITAPRESGEGAFLAMKRALKNASMSPASVDYINAHATSTVIGDAAENSAVKRLLLGDNGKQSPADINVSSVKGAVGHLLGAAGAVEAIFTIMSLHSGILPPTLNLENSSEGFDCNYVPQQAQDQNVNVAISNSFGFGGTSASLCFAKL